MAQASTFIARLVDDESVMREPGQPDSRTVASFYAVWNQMCAVLDEWARQTH